MIGDVETFGNEDGDQQCIHEEINTGYSLRNA